jgi:hypothetical protein
MKTSRKSVAHPTERKDSKNDLDMSFNLGIRNAKTEYPLSQETTDRRKRQMSYSEQTVRHHDTHDSNETINHGFTGDRRPPCLRRVSHHSNMADELGSQYSDIKYSIYSTDDDSQSYLEMSSSRRGSHDTGAQKYYLTSYATTPRASDLEHWRSQIPRHGSVDEPVTRPPSVMDGLGSGTSSGACSPKRSSFGFASSSMSMSKGIVERRDVFPKPQLRS